MALKRKLLEVGLFVLLLSLIWLLFSMYLKKEKEGFDVSNTDVVRDITKPTSCTTSKKSSDCTSTEYYCPLTNSCNSYCGNVYDQTGKLFPCDSSTSMPYSPNDNTYTYATDGSSTVTKTQLATSALDPSQLSFDVGMLSGTSNPSDKFGSLRTKIFGSPTCSLLVKDSTKTATVSLYSELLTNSYLNLDMTPSKYGEDMIYVSSTSGFSQYDSILVGKGSTNEESCVIADIKNNIMVVRGLTKTHKAGEKIGLLL